MFWNVCMFNFSINASEVRNEIFKLQEHENLLGFHDAMKCMPLSQEFVTIIWLAYKNIQLVMLGSVDSKALT